ncbi:polysaccharide biosynthesis/export family protein [Chelativorans salis]|uniref:SLBB domain-containing protein n=1 Tax=Chelativorans salis TaxID=2978478 RepID=A0ABT2LQV3_9HYPH|nr:SLBB domain-containing protein [Chelativorans sp. EGI FJ00035]MCT7376931.1 SLBB domain-containing protein [Chelativorans sp. EGI FJ00035]
MLSSSKKMKMEIDMNIYNNSGFSWLRLLLFNIFTIWAGFSVADSLDMVGYALAPGDTVKFDILDDEKDPIELPIALDGSIQAPYIGAVPIAGLAISGALKELSRRYSDQQIFVAPKLALSVAAYRPIYVMGDVRQPGAYDFKPQITVEKAVALAGGQVIAAAADDPVLARARIRGELEAIEAKIVGAALSFARLTAQLAGRDELLDEDVPTIARPYITGPVAASLRGVELRILTAGNESFAMQEGVLMANLEDAQDEIALLEELGRKVERAVELSRADLERARELQRRGIQTLTEVSNVERQTAMEEIRQLQVLSDLSAARRNVGTLKSRLAELVQQRRVGALVELQIQNTNLATAIAARRAAEEQLALLSSMTVEELANNNEIVLDFTIRRQTDDGLVELSAAATTPAAPGDVIVVRMIGGSTRPTAATLPRNDGASREDAGASISAVR